MPKMLARDIEGGGREYFAAVAGGRAIRTTEDPIHAFTFTTEEDAEECRAYIESGDITGWEIREWVGVYPAVLN